MRALHVLWAVLFLFGAAVQYNDPDPVPWMLVYLSAAAVCGVAVVRRIRWWMPGSVAAVASAWALSLAPRVLAAGVPYGSLWREMPMGSIAIEESREMHGLLLIAAWMAVIFAQQGRLPLDSARAP
jgi:hypothetical protein